VRALYNGYTESQFYLFIYLDVRYNMAAISDQLRITLQLVEETRAAICRVPVVPEASLEDVLRRLSAATDQLAHLQASLPPELRFHALYPAMIPADPGHLTDFLSTRQPGDLQQETAAAEAAATQAADAARDQLIAAACDRIRLAGQSTIDEMRRTSAAARKALGLAKCEPSA
jgi:hypothetical protein